MAVEKMKLINIIGPIAEFDRIAMKYVIDKNIHLEDMFKVFANTPGLYPFVEGNPYGQLMKTVTETMNLAGIDTTAIPAGDYSMATDEILPYCEDIKSMINGIDVRRNEIVSAIETNSRIIAQVKNISGVNIPLKEIFDFKNIKIRFGRMPKDSFKKLTQYLNEYYAGFFFKLGEDKDVIYGLYCSPDSIHGKMDAIFSSLYFERMRIPEKASGTPREVMDSLQEENERLDEEARELSKNLDMIIGKERKKLLYAYKSAYYLYEAFDVRKYAAHTKESFYIAGWVPVSDAENLAALLEPEQSVTLIFEEPDIVKHLKPPTKLKNNWLFRPFESFVEMYGLPSYDEIDPTSLFAISYSLMFGMMYGDVGHGLVLALIGVLLQRKGNFLGAILKICGIVAAFFGLIFGSIFGFELEYGFMYKPMAPENMMKTLVIAVALGSVVIGIAMLFNIANGFKQKQIGKVLFDSNGLAGFIFYWAVIAGVISVVMGSSIMQTWYIILFVVLPLVVVFLKEPLSRLFQRRADWVPKNKGEFILESFFELFELILSYITNTISFIRVGAFALNHAGMMMVVYLLANVEQHSLSKLNASNIFVLIFGNALVIGLEGLLVAIQVLRLEYYEMFSRYFAGDGKPFAPRIVNQK